MLQHGGGLNKAAKKYNIPLDNWVDCSTGINPNSWPIPKLPQRVFHRLPEADDNLHEVARHYYQAVSLLAIPGSQSVIQLLPQLRSTCRVAVPETGYAEHAHAWEKAGHNVVYLNGETEAINKNIPLFDVLIIINPNNPTGKLFSVDNLLSWHHQLAKKGGWLIVDEAFIDTRPEHSLAQYSQRKGLIILRSLGKFFGLAGIRSGFVLAESELLLTINNALGPWCVSGPSRFITLHALQDKKWQNETAKKLKQQSIRLKKIIENDLQKKYANSTLKGADLFQTLCCKNAKSLHEALAYHGIFTRLLDNEKGVRFGLPKSSQWSHLESVFGAVSLSV